MKIRQMWSRDWSVRGGMVAVLCLALILSDWSPSSGAMTRPAPVHQASAWRVVLDPGHGWRNDPGATANGMREADITLDVANRAERILESYGMDVELTRRDYEPNVGLASADDRANAFDPDLVVSIHVNAGGGTGTESCYVVNKSTSDESKRLAALLTNHVSARLDLRIRGNFPENHSGRCGRGRPNLYIHWMNAVAALVELAFVDGPLDSDVAKLRDRREDFAQAIADAIVEYLGASQTQLECPGQYLAEYFSNRNLSGAPAFVQCEGWPIRHDWGDGSPGRRVGNDNFSVRWTGRAQIAGGAYSFIARADDGIRVWLDHSMIIDGWRDQSATEYSGVHRVSAGEHTIQVEYYENGGGALAEFHWEAASQDERNLARDRSVSASSVEQDDERLYGAQNAADGNPDTRWSSRQQYEGGEELEWVWVDLGADYEVSRVVLYWETAYATEYGVFVWFEGGWQEINHISDGDGGVDIIEIVPLRTCCVAVEGFRKVNSSWGYSLWELEVYGR